MTSKFTDYNGPTGPFVATDTGILSLADPRGMAAIMDSAMLVSLGYTQKAAEYQRLIEERGNGAAEPHPERLSA